MHDADIRAANRSNTLTLSLLAQGLAYLADQKVIHGDLKPANLLIGGDRRVKLADFGSVLTWSEAGNRWEGPLNGTPAFRAPETLAQPAELSPQVRWVSACAAIRRSPAAERVQHLDARASTTVVVLPALLYVTHRMPMWIAHAHQSELTVLLEAEGSDGLMEF